MLIEPRRSDDLGLVLLLDLALKELISRYPDSSSTHAVDRATDYLVAAADGDVVGCIGLMPVVDGVGEIKRMFVHEAHRGRGIARRLVTSVEAVARHRGATSLRLATGTRQPEAVALYESAGYRPTPPYGKYVDDPFARCYRKELG
ncbi:GNAT family N-acetyltransferase [Kribbella turkmenica]|uniref:GNAT family N-acetyltransferase n=1 Tax=Kribbella turkmenica TaxID=2530375 RepID=A0A4R4XH56_9ACTN|nr:GNAT family N-acetyltransferase [Kribbella turkmenica]TDD30288.1 GNAT family N-acetyltransferase [Kribbella turkmenica]